MVTFFWSVQVVHDTHSPQWHTVKAQDRQAAVRLVRLGGYIDQSWKIVDVQQLGEAA